MPHLDKKESPEMYKLEEGKALGGFPCGSLVI
jgi:hypothetical protein